MREEIEKLIRVYSILVRDWNEDQESCGEAIHGDRIDVMEDVIEDMRRIISD